LGEVYGLPPFLKDKEMDKETKAYFENIQTQLKDIDEDVKEIKNDVKENSVKEQKLEVEQAKIKTRLNIYTAIAGSVLLAATSLACKVLFF
jgi:predicted  nucleic acid-binding Zn-ribbon protein